MGSEKENGGECLETVDCLGKELARGGIWGEVRLFLNPPLARMFQPGRERGTASPHVSS